MMTQSRIGSIEMPDRVYELAMGLKPFEVEEEIKQLLSAQANADGILNSLGKAMVEACERYDRGEFSLPHLSTMITTFHMGYELLKEKVKNRRQKGRILIGTLGSIHYIGKDIIKVSYIADGFDVHDLGENLLAGNFIKGIREFGPDIVAVSMFLTNAMPELRKIVEFLEKNDLRERTKIIIGGVQGNPTVAKKFRLDGWGHDPKTALKLASDLIGGLRKEHE